MVTFVLSSLPLLHLADEGEGYVELVSFVRFSLPTYLGTNWLSFIFYQLIFYYGNTKLIFQHGGLAIAFGRFGVF